MAHTKYIWNPVDDNVIMEKDGNGATKARYTHEPGRFGKLISQHRSGQTHHYHFDGQGSTRALTDENQSVTDTYTYSAFGEEVAKTGATANPYRYVGEKGYCFDEEMDDYYARRRVYGPAVGRWKSRDPLGFLDGMNVFVYVFNSPLSLNDPSGLRATIPVGEMCDFKPTDACAKRTCWTETMCEGCTTCECSHVALDVTEDDLQKWVDTITKDECCKTDCEIKVKVGECVPNEDFSWTCTGAGAPKKRTIYICISKVLGSCHRVAKLYHEMVHARQLCEMPVPCFDRTNCRKLEKEAHEVDCSIQAAHLCRKDKKYIRTCTGDGVARSCGKLAGGEHPCDHLKRVFGDAAVEHDDVRIDPAKKKCKKAPSK